MKKTRMGLKLKHRSGLPTKISPQGAQKEGFLFNEGTRQD